MVDYNNPQRDWPVLAQQASTKPLVIEGQRTLEFLFHLNCMTRP